jgi:hypothetical protein
MPSPKSNLAKLADRIRRRGFDLSRVSDGAVTVRCSQCNAIVVNDIPCHEPGCPNQKGVK